MTVSEELLKEWAARTQEWMLEQTEARKMEQPEVKQPEFFTKGEMASVVGFHLRFWPQVRTRMLRNGFPIAFVPFQGFYVKDEEGAQPEIGKHMTKVLQGLAKTVRKTVVASVQGGLEPGEVHLMLMEMGIDLNAFLPVFPALGVESFPEPIERALLTVGEEELGGED